MGLETRFKDDEAREMLDVTLAVDELIVSILCSLFGKVVMIGVVIASGFPPGALHRTTRGKLTLSVMTEDVTAGLEGACTITVCCKLGTEVC